MIESKIRAKNRAQKARLVAGASRAALGTNEELGYGYLVTHMFVSMVGRTDQGTRLDALKAALEALGLE